MCIEEEQHPIDLLRSYHFRMLYLMEEDCWDFQEAWHHQHSRLQGENLPRFCRDSHLLQYEEIGKLGKWIEQLFSVVGRDRCLVLVFDDFKHGISKTISHQQWNFPRTSADADGAIGGGLSQRKLGKVTGLEN